MKLVSLVSRPDLLPLLAALAFASPLLAQSAEPLPLPPTPRLLLNAADLAQLPFPTATRKLFPAILLPN